MRITMETIGAKVSNLNRVINKTEGEIGSYTFHKNITGYSLAMRSSESGGITLICYQSTAQAMANAIDGIINFYLYSINK